MANEELFNFSITIPTPTEYKRHQVFDIFMGWSCRKEISSTPATLTCTIYSITDSDCEKYKLLVLTQIPHRSGTLRHYSYNKQPID